MYVLLDLESRTLLLHLDAEDDVKVHLLLGGLLVVLAILVEAWVIGILHVVTTVLPVALIDAGGQELLVNVFLDEVLTREIHHGTGVTGFVQDEERGYAGILGHLGIIGTEGRCNVYDTRTILGRDIVTRDDAESLGRLLYHHPILQRAGLHPGHELLVTDTAEVGTLAPPEYLKGLFLSFLILLSLEIGIHAGLSNEIDGLLAAIGVLALEGNVVNAGSHTEGRVAGQCPGRGGPGQDIDGQLSGILKGTGRLRHVEHAELGRHRGVLHIAVATGLVQLVGRKSRTSGRTVGLDGISLVEEVLLVELLEKPPEGFDVLVVVGDVGMLQINPIAHLVGQVRPLIRVHHDVLAAGIVVVIHADFLTDILLGDAEALLHTQFHGKSVGVPSGLAVHLIALHGLIAQDGVLDGTSHHMMYARVSVGRRRSLEEYVGRTALALRNTAVEEVFLLPL